MRLQEEPHCDCALACLRHSEQTHSFEQVLDVELQCKLNFAAIKPISDDMRKQETENEKMSARESEKLCVWDYL